MIALLRIHRSQDMFTRQAVSWCSLDLGMADGQASKNPLKGCVKGLLGRHGFLPVRDGGPSSTTSTQSRPLSPTPSASSKTPTASANDAATTSTQTAQTTIAQQLWDEAIARIRSSKEYQGIYAAINDQLIPAVRVDAAAYSGAVPALVKDIADNLAAKSQKPRSRQRWVFDHAIGILTKFMVVGDVAVNFDPVHAALPWAAVRFVLLVRMQEGHTLNCSVNLRCCRM
jgi:hypothetical protein